MVLDINVQKVAHMRQLPALLFEDVRVRLRIRGVDSRSFPCLLAVQEKAVVVRQARKLCHLRHSHGEP